MTLHYTFDGSLECITCTVTVVRAEDWPWSSVRAHLASRDDGFATVAPVLSRFPSLPTCWTSAPTRLRSIACAAPRASADRSAKTLSSRGSKRRHRARSGQPTAAAAPRLQATKRPTCSVHCHRNSVWSPRYRKSVYRAVYLFDASANHDMLCSRL